MEKKEINIQPFCLPHPDGKSSIEFPGYSFESLSLAILSGDNGAGKTTYLEYLRSHPEMISINNTRAKVVLLDQMYERQLYPYKPVWWNITLPKIISDSLSKDQAKSIATELLKRMHLSIDIERYPTELSGGEKHLILLARMVQVQQNFLLLDEPVTGVDSSRVQAVWGIVREIAVNESKQIIMATHRDSPSGKLIKSITFKGFSGKSLRLHQVRFKGVKYEKNLH